MLHISRESLNVGLTLLFIHVFIHVHSTYIYKNQHQIHLGYDIVFDACTERRYIFEN